MLNENKLHEKICEFNSQIEYINSFKKYLELTDVEEQLIYTCSEMHKLLVNLSYNLRYKNET